jgi:hypothetical protein
VGAVKRASLVALLLTLLLAAPAAAVADPAVEVTFFSDPGHYVGAGWEQRWTSADEHIEFGIDAERNTLSIAVGPQFDAEEKHYFSFNAAPGERLARGTYRVPKVYPRFDHGVPAVSVSAIYGSLAVLCPYHSSGAFEIRDLVVGEDGKVQRAWVLYEQRSTGTRSARSGRSGSASRPRSRWRRCPPWCAGRYTTRATRPRPSPCG